MSNLHICHLFRVFLGFSIPVSIYPPSCQSIRPCPSVKLFTSPTIHPFVHLSYCPSIFCLFVLLSFETISPFIFLCPFISFSILLFVRPSISSFVLFTMVLMFVCPFYMFFYSFIHSSKRPIICLFICHSSIHTTIHPFVN